MVTGSAHEENKYCRQACFNDPSSGQKIPFHLQGCAFHIKWFAVSNVTQIIK